MDSIRFEKDGFIGWILLDRPQSRNALSLGLINELIELFEKIKDDDSLHVIIIAGNGPSFSSGHDLKELAGDHERSYYHNIFSSCSKLMQLITSLPQPVIAMVHGAATAAGCQLVASCDLVIASEDATFSTPGVKIGLFCSTPMVPLSRVIGPRRALDMLLTGRFISAVEAKEFGLVNRVVPSEKLKEEVLAVAHEIGNYSVFTVSFGKKSFYDQIDLDITEAYQYAVDAIVKNCLHPDAKEGINARINKRNPIWKWKE
jgi:enoyl-CoA hydratase/carnithine racemase